MSRNRTVPVPGWWLSLARQGLAKESGALSEVGAKLGKRVRRKVPFSHPVLSKVLHGSGPFALDLIEAISEEYRIPPAIYMPRTYMESVDMLNVRERYDDVAVGDEAPVVELDRKPRGRKGTAESKPLDKSPTKIPTKAELRAKLAASGTRPPQHWAAQPVKRAR